MIRRSLCDDPFCSQDFGCLSKLRKPEECEVPIMAKEGKEVPKIESFSHQEGAAGGCPAAPWGGGATGQRTEAKSLRLAPQSLLNPPRTTQP